jgi:hypothetical protein
MLAGVPLLSILCVSSSGQQQSDDGVFFLAGSGEQLINVCRAGEELTRSVGSHVPVNTLIEDAKRVGTCQGFVQGVLDRETIATTDKNGNPSGRAFCIPKEVSVEQLTKVVVKYGDNHPEELHFPGAAIVMFAMKEAFPCR